jgi:uncharacterized protein
MLGPDNAIKLLFVGPVGAGKTTAIRAISEVVPISTDVPWTEATNREKTTTTVALDYSTIQLEHGETLHIYGLPGQEYLDFMGPTVGRGALGAILLLDASSSALGEDCLHGIRSLRRIDRGMKFVIGMTKTDVTPKFSMDAMHRLTRGMELAVPIFSIDARDKAQVAQLIRALLLLL